VVPNGVPAGTYGVKGTCIAPMYEDLGAVTADPFTVTGAGAPVPERAPVTPRFPSQIEPYPTYDGQSTCSPAPKPGMIAYRDMVMAAYPATSSYGISRDCNVGGTSEHKEGRAWDWANDATTLAGRRRVANFFHWLFATDSYGHRHAMARRLGVMYLIWNRRIFRMYRANEGWTPYTGSSPHTDHVHVSLTRRGGNGRTSFWTMQLDGPNPPPPTDPPPRPRRARAEFEQTARAVDGTFEHAQVGDFDGNGKNDILWYGEGAKPEYIWWGRRGRGFVVADIRAAGRFRPMVGDYDGDGRDDILWYVPGPGQDYLWYGRTDRSWDTGPTRVATRFPGSAVGDFNGDGRDDVFWYGPGDGLDKLWFGRADRHFALRSLTVGGDFAPTAGDFDGDGRDDVLLFGRGAGADELWFGRPDRTFDATDRTINQSSTPIVGDLDANGRDDIFWYAPGTTPDRVWWGSRSRTFGAGAVTNVAGTYRPAFAGDFDEDGHDDIFWYRAGTAPDYIWWFQ
ncbi:MAG TPA: VCBS repeat-containing protein, partial [Acidimicrobiales bacterium]|nr:VCBS repeat-containing protein [Acidimicrobiales bacterium]